jgi:hypothetical protein
MGRGLGGVFGVQRYRGNQEFGVMGCWEPQGFLAVDPPFAFLAWNAVCAVGASLFFCSVNMVLVRLWMRVVRKHSVIRCMSDRESGWLPVDHIHIRASGRRPSVGLASVQRRVRKVLC